jgi:hypothetical protein
MQRLSDTIFLLAKVENEEKTYIKNLSFNLNSINSKDNETQNLS